MSKLKSALLATAVLGVSATSAPVFAAAPAPTEIVQPAVAPVVHAVDETAAAAVQKAGLFAAGTAVLAAIAGLIGWRRIRRALASAGPVFAEAAKAAADAPAAMARVVGRAAAKPFRLAAGLASLAMFAVFGVWLFDVEWLGGLAAGAAGVAMAWMGSARVQKLARVFRRKQDR